MATSSLFWIIIGYLLGSIPFGLLLTRSVGIDIRSVGSGNIGTTNVLRTGNKGLAAATLLLDAGKSTTSFAALTSTQTFFPAAALSHNPHPFSIFTEIFP